MTKTCTFATCGNRCSAKGMCQKHYTASRGRISTLQSRRWREDNPHKSRDSSKKEYEKRQSQTLARAYERYTRWSVDDLIFLRDHGKLPIAELAEIFGRTYASIQTARRKIADGRYLLPYGISSTDGIPEVAAEWDD